MKLKHANTVFLEEKAKGSMREQVAKKYDITEFAAGSIGFSPTKKKWYGWSHRAVFGFGIGDKQFEANFKGKTDSTRFDKHGTKDIKTLDDAKKSARNFSEYVS